ADAEAAGDQALYAMALRGRAEIRVARGELELARRDLDTVHDLRRHLPDPVGEVEDLRITAAVLAAEGQFAIAVRGLQDVVRRAEALTQPQLQAEASRDLAVLLRRLGRNAEAEAAARAAKAIFTDLGAEAEVRRLASHDWNGAFAAELRGSLTPLHE